jgi:hypothetical protein
LASAGDSTRNHTQHHQDLGDAVNALERNVALLTHDHSAGSGARSTVQLQQQNTHQDVDTDLGPLAIHHTLGPRRTNAAPGDHTHPQGTPPTPPIAQWTYFQPTLYYSGDSGPPGARGIVNLGLGYSIQGRWILVNHELSLEYSFTWGNPPYYGGHGPIFTYLPKNFVTSPYFAQNHMATRLGTQPRTGPLTRFNGQNWIGGTYIGPNSNMMVVGMPWRETNCTIANYCIAGSPGATDTSIPYIPGGFAEGGNLYIQGSCEVNPV